jgi:hypothetical protein
MLRLLILLLVLANCVYFAWTQGALTQLGLAPTHQADPERLQQQVLPELLLVMPATSSPAVLTTPPTPTDTASAPAR